MSKLSLMISYMSFMTNGWNMPHHVLNDYYFKEFVYNDCRNSNFGLVTKARACKSASQKWGPGITFHVLESAKECEGMTLPSELPLWELES